MFSPVFILGCGRSGTTILGRTLSMHRQIKYLNEPRELWYSAYPITDIWSDQASVRKGKLDLYAKDANEEHTRALTASFMQELLLSGRQILIEKLPINNFRANFIREMFPAARYIYIWRNGCEVAQSIEKICLTGKWFGSSDYKWNLLADFAKRNPSTAHLPELCTTYYLKGLLEWRLSVSAATEFLDSCSGDDYVSCGYNALTDNPLASIESILRFLGIGMDDNVVKFVQDNIRPSQNRFARELSELEREIGGSHLEASISHERLPFSPNSITAKP